MLHENEDFDSYSRKSKRVFRKVYEQLAAMNIDESVIDAMKPRIRRLLDEQFDVESFDYNESSKAFLVGLGVCFRVYRIPGDQIKFVCEEVVEALEYDFSDSRGND